MARIDDYQPDDLELTWGEDEAPSVTRPRVMDRHESRSWRNVFLSWAVAAVLLFGAGTCTGDRLNDGEVRDLVLDANQAEVRASQAQDAATYWQSEATSATAAFEAVESDVASLTASLQQWQLQAQEASSTIATLKQQKRDVKPSTAAPVQVQASGTTLSTDQVRALLTEAAGYYGLDAASSEWIVTTGLRVAYRESRYQTGAVNASGHAGLFQFSAAWGPLEQRCDPSWACYRFVKVYVDGGESKIKQHWAATV